MISNWVMFIFLQCCPTFEDNCSRLLKQLLSKFDTQNKHFVAELLQEGQCCYPALFEQSGYVHVEKTMTGSVFVTGIKKEVSVRILQIRILMYEASKSLFCKQYTLVYLECCIYMILGHGINLFLSCGKCTKLHTVATSNNRDHPTRSLYYCFFVLLTCGCCSLRTSCLWWIAL